MFIFIRLLFLCLLLILTKQTVTAQDITDDFDITDELQYSFWGGYSFSSVKFLGKTPDAQTTITGIGVKKLLRNFSNGAKLFYSADVIPYLQYEYPKRDEGGRRVIGTGWGMSPIGYFLVRPVNRFFHPFVQTTGGFIQMDKTFPTDLGRKLNFTFDITFGTRMPVYRNYLLTLGYKFHHISNAQTGTENPGLDSNFLFLSFSIQ